MENYVSFHFVSTFCLMKGSLIAIPQSIFIFFLYYNLISPIGFDIKFFDIEGSVRTTWI